MAVEGEGEEANREAPADRRLIAIVGVCAAGKTTLVENLRRLGYHAKQVAQEHSYVPHMWRRITNPDVLIYLHASYEVAIARRPDLDYGRAYWEAQHCRLAHAREHADLVIYTDGLTPDEVLQQAVWFLQGTQGEPREAEGKPG